MFYFYIYPIVRFWYKKGLYSLSLAFTICCQQLVLAIFFLLECIVGALCQIFAMSADKNCGVLENTFMKPDVLKVLEKFPLLAVDLNTYDLANWETFAMVQRFGAH